MPRQTRVRDAYSSLPAAARRVIDRCRSGAVLAKVIRSKPVEGEDHASPSFHIEPGGRRVGAVTADIAIRSGLLAPNGDGLFGDDTSQTWRAA